MSEEIRNRAFRVYEFYAKSGHPLTLRDLALRSEELLGVKIAHEQVRDWSKADDWPGRVRVTFEGSEELARTRKLLDIAYDGIMFEEAKANLVAVSSSMFKKLMTKIPDTLYPLLEAQVDAVRERLYTLIVERKSHWPRSSISTMSGAWADLERYVLPDLPQEDGAVFDLDDIVLEGPSDSPGS